MKINLKQLEINVNLHSLQPGFLNHELYYIIASNENTFRFAAWSELPQNDEQKFYCFLLERELFIPAGSISLHESYVLTDKPVYPLISNENDFNKAIETVISSGTSRFIRCFSDEDIGTIKNKLEKKLGTIQKHLIRSSEAQHVLLVLDTVEISISATMLYFRQKAPFSDSHYNNAKE